MRKFLIASVVSIALAGCSSISIPGWVSDITSGQAGAIVSAVQAAVAKACQVEPDAVDILALWNATWAADANLIAQQICSAVGPAPASAKFHRARFGRVWTPSPTVINGRTVHFD